MDVQQQQGGADCGLFAIANATSICFGLDPVHVTYQQCNMRDHLLKCIEANQLTPFPQEEKRRVITSSCKRWDHVNVSCKRRLPDDGQKNDSVLIMSRVVSCTLCKETHHQGTPRHKQQSLEMSILPTVVI